VASRAAAPAASPAPAEEFTVPAYQQGVYVYLWFPDSPPFRHHTVLIFLGGQGNARSLPCKQPVVGCRSHPQSFSALPIACGSSLPISLALSLLLDACAVPSCVPSHHDVSPHPLSLREEAHVAMHCCTLCVCPADSADGLMCRKLAGTNYREVQDR
jgi:hypothetical protein